MSAKLVKGLIVLAISICALQSNAQISNPPALKMYRYVINVDVKGDDFECQSVSLIPRAPEEAFNLNQLRSYLEVNIVDDSSFITDYQVFCPSISDNTLAKITLVVTTVYPLNRGEYNPWRNRYVSRFLERLTAKHWGSNDGYFRRSPAERFEVKTILDVDNRSPLPPRK